MFRSLQSTVPTFYPQKADCLLLPARCKPPSPHPTSPPGREQRGNSLVLLSLNGTEKARKPTGAVGKSRRGITTKIEQRLPRPRHQGPLAHPPASQRPSTRLAQDAVVSDPARPFLALPPRALTAAAASHGPPPPCQVRGSGEARSGGKGWSSPSASRAGRSAGRLTHLVALVGLERSDRRLGELHMQYGDVILPQPSARQPIALLFPQARRPPCRHLKLPGVLLPTPLRL